MIHRLRLISIALLLAGALAVPAAAEDAETLSYAASGYVVLDPAGFRYDNDERLILALWDCLTRLDPKTGAVEGAAAERWEVAPDGLTWTFHLRPGATWSDGTPVKAEAFVAGWRRAVDPYRPAPWAHLFRPLKGCALIADGAREMEALREAYKGLAELAEDHPGGVPGSRIRRLVEASGVARHIEEVDDADIKRLLRWGDDNYPTDKAKAVSDRLKNLRREVKSRVLEVYDAFGTTYGAVARGDLVLEVLLDHPAPWLAELLARAPFAPLHERTLKGDEGAWEPLGLVTNGPYRLKARGPKARAGLENPQSVVHLERREDYAGDVAGAMAEILCYTDQGITEDLRLLEKGDLQWLTAIPAGRGEAVSKMQGYDTRPTGEVLVLRFRCDRPPFDTVEARRAFALAVDRSVLAKPLWPAPAPAKRLLPSTIEGAPGTVSVPAGGANAAKAALEKTGWKGDDLPFFDLRFADRPGQGAVAEAILKSWEKILGIECGVRIETPFEQQAVLAAGAYEVSVSSVRGSVRDPWDYVAIFRSGHPQGGAGWEDAAFDALIDGAADPAAFLENADEILAAHPELSSLASRVAAARGAGADGPGVIRLALLAAAEQRLLDECVVVPLLELSTDEVRRGVEGLGSAKAWKDPAFHGSLRTARR